MLKLLKFWFNQSLGEKMLHHLHLLIDKEQILKLRVWKADEVPKLAAAVIDLFHLMPSASRFVEVLVKTTVKLEQAWGLANTSPLRDPLARFLTANCASESKHSI